MQSSEETPTPTSPSAALTARLDRPKATVSIAIVLSANVSTSDLPLRERRAWAGTVDHADDSSVAS